VLGNLSHIFVLGIGDFMGAVVIVAWAFDILWPACVTILINSYQGAVIQSLDYPKSPRIAACVVFVS